MKKSLARFDHKGLLDPVHDLYAANKDNQTFLHARFERTEDAESLQGADSVYSCPCCGTLTVFSDDLV